MDRRLMIHVSGSAYKIIQHRAYHHGTMLISSSLNELGKALKTSSVGRKVHRLASVTEHIAEHRNERNRIVQITGDYPQPVYSSRSPFHHPRFFRRGHHGRVPQSL